MSSLAHTWRVIQKGECCFRFYQLEGLVDLFQISQDHTFFIKVYIFFMRHIIMRTEDQLFCNCGIRDIRVYFNHIGSA